MKKLRLSVVALAMTVLLAGCEKGDTGTTGSYVTVDFEEAQLLTQTGNYSPTYDNILWGADQAETMENGDLVYDGIIYTEEGAAFGNYYNDYASFGYPVDSWGGFAISSNDDKENLGVMDYSNQFSVYASTVTKFAIGYDVSFMGSTATYDKPTIEFDAPCTVVSARIANANKTYHYCVDNPKGALGEEDILFELVATGYKADAVTGTVKVTLANGADVLSDWKEVSFKPLGEVDMIIFSFESNDNGSVGNNVPSFFCIDDIRIE